MNIRFTATVRTVADLLHQPGDVPAERVRVNPLPGTATIDDLLTTGSEGCELVDATLVEKPVGREESFLGAWLVMVLNQHVIAGNLGYVTGEQGWSSCRRSWSAGRTWRSSPGAACPAAGGPRGRSPGLPRTSRSKS